MNMSSVVHWKLSAALYQSGLQIPLPSNIHKNFIIGIISLMHNLEFVVNMSSVVHWKLSAALYQSGLQIPLPSNIHKNFIIGIVSLMHNQEFVVHMSSVSLETLCCTLLTNSSSLEESTEISD